MIENEQWTQAEVPIDFQLMVDQMVRVPESEADQDQSTRHLVEDEQPPRGSIASFSSSAKPPKDDGKSLSMLSVGGQKFFVVGSMLLFVKIMTDYIQCAEHVPSLTTDVLNRILELLKVPFTHA